MAEIPLPLDLTPFRAGTIWHYQGMYAYILERAELTDQVEVVHGLQPSSGGARRAEASLQLALQRMPSHDGPYPARDLDAWFSEPCTAVVNGQAWSLMSYEARASGAPPAAFRINLRRVWWNDPAADTIEETS